MAQRVRRVVFIAGMFPLPVLGLLSAATVIMIAQLRGPREALQDCALALALLATIALLVGMNMPLLVGWATMSWLVWTGLGTLQGRFGSLQLTVQVAVIVGLVALLLTLFLPGDITAFWVATLEQLYKDFAVEGVKIEADIRAQADVMSGVVAAGTLAASLLALSLANSWAAALTAGDYGAQFRRFRLGFVIGALAAVAGLAEWLGVPTHGVLLVFGVAFSFQGMAVLAWWADVLGWPRGWGVGLCILLILIPNLLIIGLALFCAIGFIDNWYSLRRKTA